MRGNGARAFLSALVVLALVGVVAIASRGSSAGGSSETRRPGDEVLDAILSLAAVAFLPVAALVVYQLVQATSLAGRTASRRNGWLGLVSLAATVAALVAWLRFRGWEPAPQELELLPSGSRAPAPTDEQRDYEPRFAWIPVLVLVALVAFGSVAYLLSTRRRATARRTDADVAQTLADVLDDTLDDLRAETDPRRAVIAAYARLERVLAAGGLARRSSETQEEYVGRILGSLDVDRYSVRRLTDLFLRAKFSQHEVDAEMKEEAIGALVQVRDDLRREHDNGKAAVEDELAAAGATR